MIREQTWAKYEVLFKLLPVYSFVTEKYSLEASIELMRDKFLGKYSVWHLFKTDITGLRELVHTEYRVPPQKVIDLKTGKIYSSPKECADILGISVCVIYAHNVNTVIKKRFEYYKEQEAKVDVIVENEPDEITRLKEILNNEYCSMITQ